MQQSASFKNILFHKARQIHSKTNGNKSSIISQNTNHVGYFPFLEKNEEKITRKKKKTEKEKINHNNAEGSNKRNTREWKEAI